jgi:hypothetical protein
VVFIFSEWSDKNGCSHTLYCTTFPTTFDGNALATTSLCPKRSGKGRNGTESVLEAGA